jgi:deoxyribose-phosphate aldolase
MISKTLQIPDFRSTPSIDKVGVEERVARIQTRSIKDETKVQGMKMILNMIDLTTLEGKDTPGKVKQMCYKAQHLHDAYSDCPTVAAVCVYPSMVKIAKDALKGSTIKVASVSTAFPSGQAPMDVKIFDTKFAVDQGLMKLTWLFLGVNSYKGNIILCLMKLLRLKKHVEMLV